MSFRLLASSLFISCALQLGSVAVGVCATTPDAAKTTLPAGFINQIMKADQTIRLTLPNGRQVVGKIERTRRDAGGVAGIQGDVLHPEPGRFSFERKIHDGQPGELLGFLRFSAKATEWRIEPGEGDGEFHMVEMPAEDAYRPQKLVMPTAENLRPAPGLSREAAEAALRKDLKIEQTAPGKLRLGLVDLDQETRTIRFPAIVNMTAGTVEYGVVTSTGKCHESLFSTSASPRDIHLGMLLLGVKPTQRVDRSGKELRVPETAAVRVNVGWERDGASHSHAITDLFSCAGKPSTGRAWLYNGSLFNGAGFGATVEGSIVSLIPDETALINNPGSDRGNDGSHAPNIKLLPGVGAPVTILISTNPSISKPESADP